MTRTSRYALTALVTTLALVAVGGYTRGSGSGYGCEDRWPLCEDGLLGGLLPRAEYHMVIEWSHRWLAAVVGLLVLATAYMAWRERRRDRSVVVPAVVAVVVVGIQGWLGRMVVKNELPRDLVAFHLSVALTVVALLTATLVHSLTRSADRPDSDSGSGAPSDPDSGAARGASSATGWSRLYGLTAVATFAVIVLGSTVHNEYVGGWPLVDNKLVPALDHRVVVLHFIHRVLAGLGFVLVTAVAWRVRRAGRPRSEVRLVDAALACYVVNVTLGAVHVFTEVRESGVVAFHLLVASIAWTALVAVTLAARRDATAPAGVDTSNGIEPQPRPLRAR